MSFKLFIYYCAICGGWAAFVGWGLGRLFAPSGEESTVARATIQGLSLGIMVALGVGLVDALWNLSTHHLVLVALRVGVAVAVGCVGGLIGAALSQFLVNLTHLGVFGVAGWTLTGLLIGVSIGVWDLLARLARGEDLGGARRKLMHGFLGGAVGGLLGGLVHLLLGSEWGLRRLFQKDGEDLVSPSALGFVALGLCIGLFIGLAQIILKEAWIQVEAGFRAGREMILSKAETTIGRAESCDIGLFGDPAIERTHARILLQGNRYVLADAGTPGGTFLNDQRITQPTPLRSGDAIRIGQSVLRFGERQKRTTV